MRVGPPAIPHWNAVLSAQLTQTVGQAAGHRSVSTDRPVEPANTVKDHTTLRRVSPHTFDITV